MSNKDIADVLGAGPSAVSNVLVRHGLRGQRKERKQSLLQSVVTDYKSGMTQAEISEKHGVAQTTICSWLRSAGVSAEVSEAARRAEAEKQRKKREEKRKQEQNLAKAKRQLEAKRRQEAKKRQRQQRLAEEREIRLAVPRTCKECGSEFHSSSDSAIYCSDDCRKKARNRRASERKRRKGSTGSYRKRMRIEITRDTYDRSVTLGAVYKKYRGKCCSCGRKTIRTKEYSPSQATLDHVIALGNNGTHTWDNVQLLCAECNSVKRDLGQMRLAI